MYSTIITEIMGNAHCEDGFFVIGVSSVSSVITSRYQFRATRGMRFTYSWVLMYICFT